MLVIRSLCSYVKCIQNTVSTALSLQGEQCVRTDHCSKNTTIIQDCPPAEDNSYPSPVRAQHAWMCHWWSLMEVSFRNWEISATVIHSLTSCLLAKISRPAFFKSLGERRRKTITNLPSETEDVTANRWVASPSKKTICECCRLVSI